MSVQHRTHTVDKIRTPDKIIAVSDESGTRDSALRQAQGSEGKLAQGSEGKLAQGSEGKLAEGSGRVLSERSRRFLAVFRFATGFIFLWAFLDKTFGLGYATTGAKSWLNGGSPTKGFLASADIGPFTGIAHAIAGAWWADWLFMLGMLAVGVAVMAGFALWPSAVVGSVILLMMWAAEFPLARFTATGAPSGSSNPIVDYHIIYALALFAVAFTSAGLTWGLGRYWNRLPYIRDHAWTH